MDKHNKGIIGGIYIKPNDFEKIQNKEDDIWIGINPSIMFVDDNWTSPSNNFEITQDGIANFKGLYIKPQNRFSSFGGIEITNNNVEQDN